jgi:predicted amidophosphoribosyltransferase
MWCFLRSAHLLLLIFACVFVLAYRLAITYWPRLVREKVLQELLEHDHQLCTACGYPLKALLDRRTCPECGTPFDPDGVRANWKFWVEHRRLPKWSTTSPL